jgi:hypothetical protein
LISWKGNRGLDREDEEENEMKSSVIGNKRNKEVGCEEWSMEE